MEKEKIEKIKQGLKCCGNKSPLAACENCPYDHGSPSPGECVGNLLRDSGELVAELTGTKV